MVYARVRVYDGLGFIIGLWFMIGLGLMHG